MAKPVSEEVAKRRRERLAELLAALGAARGSKVTQREFAASIGREQGTVAAILGGHRALGGDVMLAIVQAYGLPVDYFEAPLRPDPRPFARASGLAARPSSRAVEQGPPRSSDPALAEALASLRPDRGVAMALERLAQKGLRHDVDAWARLAIAAQSASDRGELVALFDLELRKLARAQGAEGSPEGAPKQAGPQRALPLAPVKTRRSTGSS